MRRHLAASAALGVGLLAVVASGQPPAADKAPAPKPADKKAADKKPADEIDRLIESALATDPDVRMARARIQLAEAELAKARQAVALRVTTVRAGITAQQATMSAAGQQAAAAEQRTQAGTGSREELLLAREKFEATAAKLAGLEAELKLLTGDGPTAAVPLPPDRNPEVVAQLAAMLGDRGRNDHVNSLLAVALAAQKRRPGPAVACNSCHADADAQLLAQDWLGCVGIRQHALSAGPAAPKGPVSDRIRAALDKPVRLGPKGEKVTWEEAVEAFKKDAGLDVAVRTEWTVEPVVSPGETLPVGAWLRLFAENTPDNRLAILVREYGLLVARQDFAPPDAVSVFDLWKQKPAAKADAPKPKL